MINAELYPHEVIALPNENSVRLPRRTDEELALLVRHGGSEAFAELTERYAPLIRAKAAPLRSGGSETEDLCQEGLLGLFRAAQTFSTENGASFRTYADVCISNGIRSAYRSAAGKKHDPLNDFVSLSGENAPELPDSGSADPAAMVDSRESFRVFCRRLASLLTPMELQVLRLYLGGCSYRGIAEKMSVTEKAADNALQRARMKLRNMELAV